jgi:glycosyltransferase involved in cell wall biosynthesis
MPRQILFVSKHVDAASTRYRALQFFPQLAAAGYTVTHATAAGSPAAYLHVLLDAHKADVVVVLRKTFPAPYLWLLRRLAKRLVFDFDDAIFCNSDGSASATRMHRFASMASVCDHILAGNQYLADKATGFNQAVTVIPTCIDTTRYVEDSSRPSNYLDLVWIGSRSTRKYLMDALPALRLASKRVPNLRLKIIADFDLPDAGLPVLAVPWNAATEARELGSAHIGIAPMRDNDWTRGKCALKVLQYMAAGLPVVSSNAGANAEILIDGETGFLVGDDHSWAERIAMLAGNPEMRDRMGMAGRRRVMAGYSLEPVFSRMLGVFKALP